MRTHRRHTGTTADEDHFRIGIFGEELTERPVNGHFIAGFQAEYPRRHLAGRQVILTWRRRGDTDVELHQSNLFRVVGHGVGADHGFFDLRHVLPLVELVPVATIFLLDIEIFVADLVRRAFQLNVPASSEIDFLTFRQLQGQFFDEGSDVRV